MSSEKNSYNTLLLLWDQTNNKYEKCKKQINDFGGLMERNIACKEIVIIIILCSIDSGDVDARPTPL